MKKSRYSEHQIVQILKQADAGMKAADICRQYGISETTYYNWKAKYGGMESSDIKRLREVEAENQRLKRMYTELSLDHQILKEIVEKVLTAGRRRERVAEVRQEHLVSERRACRIVGIHFALLAMTGWLRPQESSRTAIGMESDASFFLRLSSQ